VSVSQKEREDATGTVVVAQEETEESVETEPVEDVPGERGYPSDIHIWRVDTALGHLLEAEGEGRGSLTRNPQTKKVNEPVILCAPTFVLTLKRGFRVQNSGVTH
jgi:hypothetical protein